MIKPPFNYTGNKNRLIEEFSNKYFPKEKNLRFIDVFGGGGTISINANFNFITYNDTNLWVVDLLRVFKTIKIDEILLYFKFLTNKYKLTSTHLYGNALYKRIGNNGLKKENTKGFIELRKDINLMGTSSKEKSLMILFLSFYSFNNDIRFNLKDKINIPVGKTDYNSANYNKVVTFLESLKRKKIKIMNKSFEKIKINNYDFFYLDPPYFGTDAIYNKNWGIKKEEELHEFILSIHNSDKKFVLSNMSWRKGVENKQLIKFAKENFFYIYNIDYSYKASSYNRERTLRDQEVIITNVKKI